MKSKIWIILFLVFSLGGLGVIAGITAHVDPFFHYHAPDTEQYLYRLNNERSQNDGIVKHFPYNAVISGTSMVENFKTSEMDRLFGVSSIKVPYAGATYHEIHEILQTAFTANPEIQMVLWGLDMGKFFDSSEQVREDLGDPPSYLYDKNPFNDVNYVLNRDVIFSRVYTMLKERNEEGFQPGITSFDQYANWMRSFTFGRTKVFQGAISETILGEELTEEEKIRIQENIRNNVTSLMKEYPDTVFYCFYTPYSAAWWESILNDGKLTKQLAAEQLITEELLKYENCRLFSFNTRTDVTGDLNNYKDARHYGVWVNSLILKWMQEEAGRLTPENYLSYLEEERAAYIQFDYKSLHTQEDYENDYYAAALVNEELTGAKPMPFTQELLSRGELRGAQWAEAEDEGGPGFLCSGTLNRKAGDMDALSDYLFQEDYQGLKLELDQMDDYNYLVFTGQKIKDHGHPRIYVYNKEGELLTYFARSYSRIDQEPHSYTLDLTEIQGDVILIFQGGYIDQTGREDSAYLFRDICLY